MWGAWKFRLYHVWDPKNGTNSRYCQTVLDEPQSSSSWSTHYVERLFRDPPKSSLPTNEPIRLFKPDKSDLNHFKNKEQCNYLAMFGGTWFAFPPVAHLDRERKNFPDIENRSFLIIVSSTLRETRIHPSWMEVRFQSKLGHSRTSSQSYGASYN